MLGVRGFGGFGALVGYGEGDAALHVGAVVKELLDVEHVDEKTLVDPDEPEPEHDGLDLVEGGAVGVS